MPAFRQDSKTNILSDRYAPERRDQSEQFVVRKLVGSFFGRGEDVHPGQRDRTIAAAIDGVGLVLVPILAVWLIAESPFFHKTAPPGLRLSDLRAVSQLRARFDADRGMTRLILVLSPT